MIAASTGNGRAPKYSRLRMLRMADTDDSANFLMWWRCQKGVAHGKSFSGRALRSEVGSPRVELQKISAERTRRRGLVGAIVAVRSFARRTKAPRGHVGSCTQFENVITAA